MFSLYPSCNVLKKLQNYGEDICKYSVPVITGVAKNDVLYRDIKHSKHDRYYLLDRLTDSNYNLLLYIPTAMSKNWDSPLQSINQEINLGHIDRELSQLNSKLIVKLHPRDKKYLGKIDYENIIILPGNIDIYPYLKDFDVIVGDYASMLYDILHLEVPIVRYLYDITRSQLFDSNKDFIRSYRGPIPTESESNPLIPCRIAFNVDELISVINTIMQEGFEPLHDNDDRNQYFKFSDGYSSTRAVTFIKKQLEA
jgi:CDP-glycerol glycerophosphotransferase (TagB/SpsB family)